MLRRNFSHRRLSLVSAVILSALLVRLYYVFAVFPSADESRTYLWFVKNGFWHSLTYYSAPNNHVLNSLLMVISMKIPFLPFLLKLRLPALIFSVLSLFVFHRFVRNFFPPMVSLTLLALFSFLWINIYYGFSARGYSATLFFFLLSVEEIFKIIKRERVRTALLRLALFSILALLFIPSYIYAYISLFSFLFFYEARTFFSTKKISLKNFLTFLKSLKLYILSAFITGIVTASYYGFLLYNAPPYFWQKTKKHLGSSLAPNTHQDLWEIFLNFFTEKFSHIETTFNLLFETPVFLPLYFWIPFGIGTLWILYKKSNENRILFYFSAYLFLIYFLLVFLTKTPFARTWIHLTFPGIILLGLLIQRYIPKTHSVWPFAIITIMIIGIYNFNMDVKHLPSAIPAIKELIAKVLARKNINKVYSNNRAFALMFGLYLEEKGLADKITVVRSEAENPLQDTLFARDHYDVVVFREAVPADSLKGYSQAFQYESTNYDSKMTVYFRDK